jgi:HK97 family phage prohead protease
MEKLSPSRVQRDLAAMRARIAQLERGTNRESVAAAVASSIAGGAVRLTQTAAQQRAEVREAITYGNWLRKSPKQRTVLIGCAAGKKRFEAERAALRKDLNGARFHDEIGAVIAKLDRLPGGGVVHLLPQRAPIQKFVAGGARIVRGWASTDELDRVGDVVEPLGMKVRLPIPLLWQHDHSRPIGTISVADVRKDGVWIEARLVDGIALADEAAKLVDARAIDAFSIGFRGLKFEPLPTGGLRFTAWELLEVSLVSIPANPGARIQRAVASPAGAVRLTR